MFNKIFKKRKKVKLALKADGHVRRDWAVALLVFLIALAAIVATNGFIFFKTTLVGDVVIDEVNEDEIINEELLLNISELYEQKQERYLRYQREVPDAPEI